MLIRYNDFEVKSHLFSAGIPIVQWNPPEKYSYAELTLNKLPCEYKFFFGRLTIGRFCYLR